MQITFQQAYPTCSSDKHLCVNFNGEHDLCITISYYTLVCKDDLLVGNEDRKDFEFPPQSQESVTICEFQVSFQIFHEKFAVLGTCWLLLVCLIIITFLLFPIASTVCVSSLLSFRPSLIVLVARGKPDFLNQHHCIYLGQVTTKLQKIRVLLFLSFLLIFL